MEKCHPFALLQHGQISLVYPVERNFSGQTRLLGEQKNYPLSYRNEDNERYTGRPTFVYHFLTLRRLCKTMLFCGNDLPANNIYIYAQS